MYMVFYALFCQATSERFTQKQKAPTAWDQTNPWIKFINLSLTQGCQNGVFWFLRGREVFFKGKTSWPHRSVANVTHWFYQTERVAHDQTVHPWKAESVWPQTPLNLATLMCFIFAEWMVRQANHNRQNCPKVVYFINYIIAWKITAVYHSLREEGQLFSSPLLKLSLCSNKYKINKESHLACKIFYNTKPFYLCIFNPRLPVTPCLTSRVLAQTAKTRGGTLEVPAY